MRNFLAKRRLLFIGGGSAFLVLCILTGALFIGPLIVSAHSNSGIPTVTNTPNNPYCQQYNQNLAKRLGTSIDTLRQASKGAFEDVLAQAVKDGKLTQVQADQIKQRLESKPDHGCWRFGASRFIGFERALFLKKYKADIVNQIAQGLHLTTDQLRAQLRAGKSLNDIAQAQSVSGTDLQILVTSTITGTAKKAVEAGDLTQSQGDTITQFLQQHPQRLEKLLARHKPSA